MTGRQRERQLTSIYNRLLAMTADEKRRVLDQMAAPESSQWTAAEKGGLMMTLETGADTLPGMAGELARTLASEEQRYLALDILREPTQVITLGQIARTLGADRRRARNIEAGTRAHYLAFTFADKDRRRVDGILRRIGAEIGRETDRPEALNQWSSAAIKGREQGSMV